MNHRASHPPADYEQVRASRDPADFDAIYRALGPVVLRHLQAGFGFTRQDGTRGWFRVRSAFDAEEIAHDAFSAFFKQCLNGGFDTSRPVKPYLLRIASNAALRRSKRGAREVLVEETPPPDTFAEPRDDELKTLISTCYDALETDDQAVFDACFVEELSQAKAGKKLGLSRDQVFRSLVRIRRSVRGFFAERGWFDHDP